MKMKKKSLRFVAGVLAVTMLISSNSVFATTTAEYDEQIESIKSQQAENEAEAERLNEKLDSLRDQTSEAKAYQATLEEQITTYQTSIDLAVQNITQLNTNITNLEAEIKKADEEYADTFAELKVRLRSLYSSGGNLTTLQILFDSTSLYDFSMRSEAMKTITKHDRELMEKIRLYRIQTQDQRDELNKEKEELADQKKDLEKKQEELQALEEENQKLIDELNIDCRIRSVPYPMLDMIARSMERFGDKTAKEPAFTHYGVSKLNFDFTLDITRAQDELGYQPVVTLDDGIVRTAAWLRDHGKLHR